MFLGEYHHTLDSKGRVAIPAKFRDAFSQGLVLTRGLDQSLWLLSVHAWTEFVQKLSVLPWAQADVRSLSRLLLAGAMEETVDSSGRVLVPEYLRTYASLHKEVVFAGMGGRLELWDLDRWQQVMRSSESRANELAERIASAGLL